MDKIKITALTVEDAILDACKELGVTEEKIKYDVIDKGNKGFLGIGAKPVIIEAWKLSEKEIDEIEKKDSEHLKNEDLNDIEKEIKEFLDIIVNKINKNLTYTSKIDYEKKLILIYFDGKDLPVIIGKNGERIRSIQFLTNIIANNNKKEHVIVRLDAGKFREKEKEKIVSRAKKIANNVYRYGQDYKLGAMNSYDRLLVHEALNDDPRVTTESIGKEPFRQVVIKKVKKYK